MARLGLDVSIDPHSGFCFGVVFAIEMAEEVLRRRGYLYCLGDVVHNDEEISRLKKLGLRTITHGDLPKLENECVLIRAHGEPPSTYETALKYNITLIDATCPVVMKLQNRIKKSYDNRENVFLVGKKGHAEVTGLMGQMGERAVVFSGIEELSEHDLPKEMTVYSQTTKSKEDFYSITNTLKQMGIRVHEHDTICSQVANRDVQMRTFAKGFDRIVFVSGKQSSNGKTLFEVCRANNPHTHLISNDQELHKDWFRFGERVGVSGATSTPMWLMEQIKRRLESF